MRLGQVIYPYGVSLALHCLLAVVLFDPVSGVVSHAPPLRIYLKAPGNARDVAGKMDGENERVAISVPEALNRSPDMLSRNPSVFGIESSSQRSSEIGVYDSSELDGGLAPLSEVSIEPEYGFSDDVSGSVDISVLVNPEGRAVWVWHADNRGLDSNTVEYMANSLRLTKFSPPMRNGALAYGIFRIRVEIGPSLTAGR